MVKKGSISKQLSDFMKSVNDEPIADRDAQIEAFANNMEETIIAAIYSADIVIPPGTIILTGASAAGPVTVTNPQPIVIKNALK